MADATGAILSPVLAYEPSRGLFLGEDNTLGFVFECRAKCGGGEETERQVRVLLEDDWPAGAQLQVLVHASPNLVCPLGKKAALRHTFGERAPAREARADAWFAERAEVGFAEFDGLHLRRLRLVISAKLPIASQVPSEAELDAAAQMARRVERNLEALSMAPSRVDARGWATICSEMLNRGPGASWRKFGQTPIDDDRFLREQIHDIGSRMRIDEDGIELEDGHRLVLLSPKGFNETIGFGLGATMFSDVVAGKRGLFRPFFIALNVDFAEPQAMKSRLGLKTTWATNAAHGPLVKWMPALATRHRDLQVMQASMEDGHRPVRWSLTVGVYGRGRVDADQAAADAINYWAENWVQLMRDRYIAAPLLINSLPLGVCARSAKDLGRARTMSTAHVAPFLPIFAAWPGTGTPLITPVARDGQMMSFDLFDSPTNYNAVVAAQSGSGKSFFLMMLIKAYLETGAKLWVIDIGGSYQKLCERLGGEYVDFADRAISMNPFSLVRDWDDERDLVQSLISAMASQSEPLTDVQRSGLSRHLGAVWHDLGRKGSIDALVQHLRGDDDDRVRDVAARLYEFSSSGIYGRYFQGQASIRFDNPFTVVELGALGGRAQLQRIVLLQLIFQIQQAMRALGTGRRKLLFIDEAWELLTDGEVGAFIENAYRRFRKHNGAAVIATQSLGDLFDKKVGLAIAENAAHKLLLQQPADTIDRVVAAKQLPVQPGMVELVKSVRSARGRYSEVFFLTERGSGIGRIVVDPHTRLLFSTTPGDVAAIDAHRAAGLSLDDAIEAVLKGHAPPILEDYRPTFAAE